MKETFGKELVNFIKKTLKVKDYDIQSIKLNAEVEDLTEIELKITLDLNK